MTPETGDSYFSFSLSELGLNFSSQTPELVKHDVDFSGLRPNQETTKQFSRYQSLIHLPRILKRVSVPLQL